MNGMFERLGMLSAASWRRGLSALLTSLFVGLFCSVPAMCEESEGRAGESAHEEHERNMIGIFTGYTFEDRRDGFALGIEYERRFSKSFGVGALVEHTFGDFDADVFSVPFAYHTGRWKTYIGPGIEDSEDGSDGLVRIGVEYGFEVRTWEVSPQVDIDFVDGDEVFVIGVTFGTGF